MTLYYTKVLKELREIFPEIQIHWTGPYKGKAQPFTRVKPLARIMICSSDTECSLGLAKLTNPASHFIRDPRDMVVSGYYYHLRCIEHWVIDPNFPWHQLDGFHRKLPKRMSYQEFLKTLDRESGMILELIRYQDSFRHMLEWDYQNPCVMEMKYEDIIGHEGECFERLFKHYGFDTQIACKAAEIAEWHSLKNMKGYWDHIRDGSVRQWKTEFTPLIVDVFKEVWRSSHQITV